MRRFVKICACQRNLHDKLALYSVLADGLWTDVIMTDIVLKEGFAVKKSGQTNLFGHYHWQKRWFILIQKGSLVTLSYYEKKTDSVPKGQVKLSNKYITREPEADEKEKPHLFAVGPFVEDGATRTYYISCESEDDKLEWMEVLNAAIEGTTADVAIKRRTRASFRFTAKAKWDRVDGTRMGAKEEMYMDPIWRKQQWDSLVSLSSCTDWKKTDTKDSVTVSRMSFSDKHGIIKVEGTVRANIRIVYRFLQSALTQGGKLDYPFRKEKLLEKISTKPSCSIVECYHEIRPLPRTRPRCATLLKMMMPRHMTPDDTCGLLITSVNHPKCTPSLDAVRISLGNSGCVLQPVPGPTTTTSNISSRHLYKDHSEDEDLTDPTMTRVTFLMQVNLQGSLQRMLKASYKSGLLVIGIRSFYQNLNEHINNYVKIVDI